MREKVASELSFPILTDPYSGSFCDSLNQCPKCCQLLFSVNPVQPSCGHHICHSCADDILRKETSPCCPECGEKFDDEDGAHYFPDHFVRREINNLVVICPFSESGCNWEGKFEEYRSHIVTCSFSSSICPLSVLGCSNTRMSKSELQLHLTTEHERHLELLVKKILSLEINPESQTRCAQLPNKTSTWRMPDIVETDGAQKDSGFEELPLDKYRYYTQLEGVGDSITSSSVESVMQRMLVGEHGKMREIRMMYMKELQARDDKIASLKTMDTELEELIKSRNAELAERNFRLSLSHHNGWKLPQFSSRKAGVQNKSVLTPNPGRFQQTVKQLSDEVESQGLHTQKAMIDVPVEIDLAHFERRRLEDEYSKLKELKRKSEQYAMEAKQTVQRLSAENAKLREDLRKERKHNEITRANIIRQFESKVSHDTTGGEKLETKMEQEIQERDEGSLNGVEQKAMEIEVIFEDCDTNILQFMDGRHAMEIAEQYGNQKIITLKRHTTSSGNPIKNGEKTSHDHMTVALRDGIGKGTHLLLLYVVMRGELYNATTILMRGLKRLLLKQKLHETLRQQKALRQGKLLEGISTVLDGRLLEFQSLLLLASGDVERNPGPLTSDELGKVDEIILSEDNCFDIFTSMSPLCAEWHDLCLALGLPPSLLSSIREDHAGDTKACLREGLVNWLQRNYNTKKHGLPTWRRLVEAADHPAGGKNHALALKIAEKHKKPELDISQTIEEPTIPHNSNPMLSAVSKKGQEISTAFANMYRNVSRLLGRSVDVDDLKEFLYYFGHPESLCQRCVDPVVFDDAVSTKDVLKRLYPEHINPIKLFILDGIVETFDSSQLQCTRLLNEYKESYF